MSKHVLLIVDDLDDVRFFSRAIRAMELDVAMQHFANGIDAVQVLEQNNEVKVDAIFLDINSPRMNGGECIRKIKDLAFSRKTPIVMYSPSTLEREGLTPADLGVTAFLTKPGRIDDLKSQLLELFRSFWGDEVDE